MDVLGLFNGNSGTGEKFLRIYVLSVDAKPRKGTEMCISHEMICYKINMDWDVQNVTFYE